MRCRRHGGLVVSGRFVLLVAGRRADVRPGKLLPGRQLCRLDLVRSGIRVFVRCEPSCLFAHQVLSCRQYHAKCLFGRFFLPRSSNADQLYARAAVSGRSHGRSAVPDRLLLLVAGRRADVRSRKLLPGEQYGRRHAVCTRIQMPVCCKPGRVHAQHILPCRLDFANSVRSRLLLRRPCVADSLPVWYLLPGLFNCSRAMPARRGLRQSNDESSVRRRKLLPCKFHIGHDDLPCRQFLQVARHSGSVPGWLLGQRGCSFGLVFWRMPSFFLLPVGLHKLCVYCAE